VIPKQATNPSGKRYQKKKSRPSHRGEKKKNFRAYTNDQFSKPQAEKKKGRCPTGRVSVFRAEMPLFRTLIVLGDAFLFGRGKREGVTVFRIERFHQ